MTHVVFFGKAAALTRARCRAAVRSARVTIHTHRNHKGLWPAINLRNKQRIIFCLFFFFSILRSASAIDINVVFFADRAI